MRLFKVTAHLLSPMAMSGPDPVHLDGVLWSASREKRRGAGVKRPPLPVYSITLYGETVAMASALLPGEHRFQQMMMVKRRDGIDVQHLGGRLHRGLGPGKDKMMPKLALDGRLEWLAVAGRRRPLLKMLRRALAIGTDIRSGHGRVGEWEVEPVETTHLEEVLVGPGGRLRRHLPVRWCSSTSDTAMGGLFAPYWKHHREVAPAGSIATLDRELLRLLSDAYDITPRPRPQDLRRAERAPD